MDNTTTTLDFWTGTSCHTTDTGASAVAVFLSVVTLVFLFVGTPARNAWYLLGVCWIVMYAIAMIYQLYLAVFMTSLFSESVNEYEVLYLPALTIVVIGVLVCAFDYLVPFILPIILVQPIMGLVGWPGRIVGTAIVFVLMVLILRSGRFKEGLYYILFLTAALVTLTVAMTSFLAPMSYCAPYGGLYRNHAFLCYRVCPLVTTESDQPVTWWIISAAATAAITLVIWFVVNRWKRRRKPPTTEERTRILNELVSPSSSSPSPKKIKPLAPVVVASDELSD